MEYKISRFLDSRAFYKMLFYLKNQINKNEEVILDFTDVFSIDALVIPNALLLGKWIESITDTIPYIRLGDDFSAGYIKKYLSGIKFYELSQNFFYYENEDEKYAGLQGKNMSPYNTTECFKYDDGLEIAKRRIYYNLMPFMRNYLGDFETFHEERIDVFTSEAQFLNENILAKFINEMVENTFIYSKCNLYVTFQVNYKKKKIYLAVSDAGIGLKKGYEVAKKYELAKQELDPYYIPDYGYNILGHEPTSELEALVFSSYKRKNSNIYGLYNVIKRVLLLEGIIRIHSNNKQIIFDKDILEKFLDESIIEDTIWRKTSILQTTLFPGVHIEIELPLNEKKRGITDANY